MVNDETVLTVRNKLREQYGREASKAIAKKDGELQGVRGDLNDAKRRSLDQIYIAGQETKRKWTEWLGVIATAMLATLFFVALFVSIEDIIYGKLPIISLILAIVTFDGLYNTFASKKPVIKHLIDLIAQKHADRVMDAKRREHNAVFGSPDAKTDGETRCS